MLSKAVRIYVTSIAVAAVVAAIAVLMIAGLPSSHDGIEAAVFFAAFGALAQALGYAVTQSTLGTIAFLPFLSAAALSPDIGSLVAVAVAVAAGETLQKRNPFKALFNVSQHTLAIALAILVYRALGGFSPLTSALGASTIPGAVPFVALFAVFMVVNKLCVSVVVALSQRRRILAVWLTAMRASFVYDVLALPLVALFAIAYVRAGAAWSAALALPMLGLRQLYKTNFELEAINEELLQLMVAAIEARDPYTSGHSQRVARYSRVVARAAGLGTRNAERVYIAALLHDVGKIHEEFAPILRKPGRLTSAEFEVMKVHAAKSALLVERVSRFRDVVPAVRGHHESWDGAGYPDRLRGEAIPLWARIITIADTIDAMTTNRPYRKAMSIDQVRDEIRTQRGRQFDPAICDSLLFPPTWAELTSEIVIATCEFPITAVDIDGAPTERIERPSGDFRVRA